MNRTIVAATFALMATSVGNTFAQDISADTWKGLDRLVKEFASGERAESIEKLLVFYETAREEGTLDGTQGEQVGRFLRMLREMQEAPERRILEEWGKFGRDVRGKTNPATKNLRLLQILVPGSLGDLKLDVERGVKAAGAAKGTYSFHVPPGTYVVAVKKRGVTFDPIEVTIGAGDLEVSMRPAAERLLGRLDKNGDGKLDASDFGGSADALQALGKTGSGPVTAADLRDLVQKGKRAARDRAARTKAAAQRRQVSTSEAARDLVTKLDKNKDGKVDQKDFADAVAWQSFKSAFKLDSAPLTVVSMEKSIDAAKAKQVAREKAAKAAAERRSASTSETARKLVTQFDKNKDGKVDEKDFADTAVWQSFKSAFKLDGTPLTVASMGKSIEAAKANQAVRERALAAKPAAEEAIQAIDSADDPGEATLLLRRVRQSSAAVR